MHRNNTEKQQKKGQVEMEWLVTLSNWHGIVLCYSLQFEKVYLFCEARER